MHCSDPANIFTHEVQISWNVWCYWHFGNSKITCWMSYPLYTPHSLKNKKKTYYFFFFNCSSSPRLKIQKSHWQLGNRAETPGYLPLRGNSPLIATTELHVWILRLTSYIDWLIVMLLSNQILFESKAVTTFPRHNGVLYKSTITTLSVDLIVSFLFSYRF